MLKLTKSVLHSLMSLADKPPTVISTLSIPSFIIFICVCVGKVLWDIFKLVFLLSSLCPHFQILPGLKPFWVNEVLSCAGITPSLSLPKYDSPYLFLSYFVLFFFLFPLLDPRVFWIERENSSPTPSFLSLWFIWLLESEWRISSWLQCAFSSTNHYLLYLTW